MELNYLHFNLKLTSKEEKPEKSCVGIAHVCRHPPTLLPHPPPPPPQIPFLACGGLISPSLRRAGKLN